ncbi:MAG: 3-phosphoglycerate dehydrogenase [Clostridiales bacterium]|mgnify:FL=1|nr:3-phosphoglycerate dehydrogenase [Clostridiales bacterium]
MFKVKTLNKIAEIGTQRLDCGFFCIDDRCESPDAILVRSAKMCESALNDDLLCIARAGAGVNNIPLASCTEKGIVVFNSPGANSGGVKELVLASLILASRDIIGGIEWVKSIADKGDEVPALVEKGKSSFVGPEIFSKTLGIIGLGAIGAKVAQDAYALGMKVMGYDPFLSDTVRTMLAGKASFTKDMADIFKNSDYITLHLPYSDTTKNTINAETIAMMKDGVRIINLARGELVNDDDIIAALESGKVGRYVTDFPNAKTANAKGVIAIPHLGASTPESEENCAIMAADEIKEYILNGNIINSVNFPSVSMERSGEGRLIVLRRNIDGMQSAFLDAIKAEGLAAVGTADKVKGDTAATLIDLNGKATDTLLSKLSAIEGVIRVRAI